MTAVDDDMLAGLRRLQAKVTEFGELANRLAAAVPRQAEGSDASGWARVVLGADGSPATIRVRDGWDRRIEASGLGAAVLDANADALRQGMRAFSDRLDDTRWWAHRARVEQDGPDPAAAEVTRPPAGRDRDPGELTEDILTALQGVQQQQQPAAAPGERTGSDPLGRVTVTLGAGGLAGCAVDPEWAARRDGATITAALTQALLAAGSPVPDPMGGDLDELLGDALATLQAITGRRPAGGAES